MGLLGKGRVNIVVTNELLRYSYNRNSSIESMVTHGEERLPEGTIANGTVMEKKQFSMVLHRLVQKHKWKRRDLAFTLPDDMLVIRQLQVPAVLGMDEAIGHLRTKIGQSIYLPFTDPAIAIEMLDVEEDQRNLLLFAYPKEKLRTFEEIFEAAGLKPVIADLTALSVYRNYYSGNRDGNEDVLLIHWNRDALLLTAFRNHKAIFSRYMKLSVHEEAQQEQIEQSVMESIREITRIIDFYQFSLTKGEGKVSRLLLSGDAPYMPSVKKALFETVPIPVFAFEGEQLSERYADVLGLAMKKDM